MFLGFTVKNEPAPRHRYDLGVKSFRKKLRRLARPVFAGVERSQLDELPRFQRISKLLRHIVADTALSDLKDRVVSVRHRAQIGALLA